MTGRSRFESRDPKGNVGLARVPVSHSAFEDCPVSNCKLTYEESVLPTADAVLFHLHRTRGRKTLPSEGVRPEHQRWVFLTDESPYHTIPGGRLQKLLQTMELAGELSTTGRPIERTSDPLTVPCPGKLTEFNGVFNWSMSYRSDSDVPVPYGRALLLTGVEKVQMAMREANEDYHRNNTKMATILISNCGGNNGRVKYLDELKKHLEVDVYGHCGNLPKNCGEIRDTLLHSNFCDNLYSEPFLNSGARDHYESNCLRPNEYKFYLSFENSNCREYLTEKVWFNAYLKNSVPVIMGAPLEDCRRFLPPGSYVHVDAFKSPRHLAGYLKHLAAMPAEYNAFFSWKKLFKVVNEHGYFDAPVFHYCRLCEALNYNERSRKVYENLDEFWSVRRDCSKGYTVAKIGLLITRSSFAVYSSPMASLVLPDSSQLSLSTKEAMGLLYIQAESNPFQTHCFPDNLDTPGITPRTSGSIARTNDH
uniref:Fucosyltransferase n=1 Tax=Timema californicum TaxID=61474 RepID=A0A7R9J8L8_TIMCA|nr:unnamed protein product [Timema californicum]